MMIDHQIPGFSMAFRFTPKCSDIEATIALLAPSLGRPPQWGPAPGLRGIQLSTAILFPKGSNIQKICWK